MITIQRGTRDLSQIAESASFSGSYLSVYPLLLQTLASTEDTPGCVGMHGRTLESPPGIPVITHLSDPQAGFPRTVHKKYNALPFADPECKIPIRTNGRSQIRNARFRSEETRSQIRNDGASTRIPISRTVRRSGMMVQAPGFRSVELRPST